MLIHLANGAGQQAFFLNEPVKFLDLLLGLLQEFIASHLNPP